MAQRRMIAKSIIETDRFYELSFEAQALYIHMLLKADDDGFNDSVRMQLLCMQLDCKYLQELIDQGYVLKLEETLIYIVDWAKQNRVQRDRYQKSLYLDKYADSYECIQSGLNKETQYSKGNYSKGKGSKEATNTQENSKLKELEEMAMNE